MNRKPKVQAIRTMNGPHKTDLKRNIRKQLITYLSSEEFDLAYSGSSLLSRCKHVSDRNNVNVLLKKGSNLSNERTCIYL